MHLGYAKNIPQPPNCVGTFEPDHLICDGDLSGETVEDRVACFWRDRCAGLQVYCEERSVSPSTVVASLSYPNLVALCEKYVENHRIVQGIVGGGKASPDPKPKPKEMAKPPPPGRPRKRRSTDDGLPNDLLYLHEHFVEILRTCFSDHRFSDGKQMIVRPATFYSVYRRRGRCIRWYCTTAQGPDREIAVVHFLPSRHQLHIELPIEADRVRQVLGASETVELQPKKNRTICRDLDREGVTFVAKTIKHLIEVPQA